MIWTVILALGSGSLKDGFSHITAQLQNQGKTIAQFSGSLPPAPDVEELQRRWKVACTGFQSSRSNPRIKIKPTSNTYISENNPQAIYEGLKKEIQEWLNAGEFYRKIEVKLRTQIGNPSAYIQIFLESDDSQIWELPWDAWNFREEYRNCEIIRSPSEYRIVPQKQTKSGILLPSRGRILCVLGNSKDIDVKKDAESIKKSIGDSCKLEFLEEPTPAEFNDRLFDEKGWQIFFFAGHSDSDDNARNGWLHINQNAAKNTIAVDDLKSGVKELSFKGLQLLIFNSCSSLGLAADLVAENYPLPSIIVMRAPIPDPIAHDFVKSLFGYLADGDPLFLAVRKAKDYLLRWESQFPGASGIPVLCQHPTFEELTLPKKEVNRPANTGENTAIEPAGDRPKKPIFVSFSHLMQRLAIGLAVSAIGYMLIGPKIAPIANKLGNNNAEKNQPLIAKNYYKLAGLLNPNYATPHYNLSVLCDKLNDSQCALQAMQNAVWRGLPDAYAQSSKSFILQNKHQEALKAIALCLENTKYEGVKASCFKNRGWVFFEQKQYDAAEADLRTAIAFREDSPEAQCLLAKVLEIKGESQAALAAWNLVLKHSNYSIPKQDECLQIARQRLQAKGNKP